MSTLVVADVGNSRIKWGRCAEGGVIDAVSLSLHDPVSWEKQRARWSAEPARWIVAGVNPPAGESFVEWLKARSEAVEVLDDYQKLPIRVGVESPERVGLDRLLNAVAASSRDRAGLPAVLVDAGTAVTVDWLDEQNVFRGGAILPGPHLMAQALHSYTARLPLVEVTDLTPPLPGTSTVAAITAGISGAVVGGIRHLVEQLVQQTVQSPLTKGGLQGGLARSRKEPPLYPPLRKGGSGRLPRLLPIVYLTGGEAERLAPALEPSLKRLKVAMEVWPFMTLEGIRLSAVRLP